MVRFIRDLIASMMDDPADLDAKHKKHLDKVLAGAELMKAGWEQTLLPRGYWRMPNNTALTRARHAEAKGFPISPYEVALEDMDMSKKLDEAQKQER